MSLQNVVVDLRDRMQTQFEELLVGLHVAVHTVDHALKSNVLHAIETFGVVVRHEGPTHLADVELVHPLREDAPHQVLLLQFPAVGQTLVTIDLVVNLVEIVLNFVPHGRASPCFHFLWDPARAAIRLRSFSLTIDL